jgi:biopolymer transport protein TolR
VAGFRKMKKFRSGGRPNSDINITPMIDVVLVLLIIFMVVTPLLEKDIEVRLPETEQMEEEEQPPPDQLVVSVAATGEISLNLEKVSEEEFQERLKRILSAKPKGERLVFFMPDEQANYGVVVRTLDKAKASGAELLGMMTTEVPMPTPTASADGLVPPTQDAAAPAATPAPTTSTP